ncbi:MAG: lipoprotein insertase outer membrane protein LolB [Pseudomonadota bacterium]
MSRTLSGRSSALLLLLVTACATRQPAPAPVPVELPGQWELEGRLALANGRDGGSGTLSWSHQAELSQLAFVGAFGRGAWRLTVTPVSAELVLSDGQVYRAPEVSELVADLTGWQIPVEALTWWVVGSAQPGFPATEQRHETGYLTALRQHGWQVKFEGRLSAGPGTLPRKITAVRGKDRVRLLVKGWRLPETAADAP